VTVLYVPRAGGSTLILTITPPVPVPTLIVPAIFRDGEQQATHRDGEQQTTYRDGVAQTGGR
jgi:hypothetical protein